MAKVDVFRPLPEKEPTYWETISYWFFGAFAIGTPRLHGQNPQSIILQAARNVLD